MKVTPTALPEVLILEPKVFGDGRGFFMESWQAKNFAAATGVDLPFVQDNHSRSVRNVLRGIHYQVHKPQGKLVRVVRGSVLDVAVDLRKSSPRFGRWVSVEVSSENLRQLWIPPGFGHAFIVLSDVADFLYKATEYWDGVHERSVLWNDETLGIDWGVTGQTPIVSEKDLRAPRLRDAEVFA